MGSWFVIYDSYLYFIPEPAINKYINSVERILSKALPKLSTLTPSLLVRVVNVGDPANCDLLTMGIVILPCSRAVGIHHKQKVPLKMISIFSAYRRRPRRMIHGRRGRRRRKIHLYLQRLDHPARRTKNNVGASSIKFAQRCLYIYLLPVL